jgi:hypothetical protein
MFAGTPPPGSTTLRGKNKSQNKNFDNHITTIYLALIPKLTIATMVMFISLNKFPTFSRPKSGGAS